MESSPTPSLLIDAQPRAKQIRYGEEVPRIHTKPLRPLTEETTRGFAAIRFAAALGIVLYPWQKWLLLHALELNIDGSYRFRTIVILVARQNGKSEVLHVLALWRMLVDGAPVVLGTAQKLAIAEDLWKRAVKTAQSDEELSKLVSNVSYINGAKALEFSNGAVYKIDTANEGGGRGLSVDTVLLDELRQHKSFDAYGAISKTTQAKDNGLVICASNAGDITAVVLTWFRKLAHFALGDPDGICVDPATGKSTMPPVELDEDGEPFEQSEESLGLFEWSADPSYARGDKRGWAQANPSMGYLIKESTIASNYRTDPPEKFDMEVLCRWFSGSLTSVFPVGAWQQGTDAESRISADSPRWACVDLDFDRKVAHIAVAGFRDDGKPHVEVIASRAGLEWVIPWFREKKRRKKYAGLVWQASGAPISSLTDALVASKINTVPWEGSDLLRGTGMMYDRVSQVVQLEDDAYKRDDLSPGVFHLPQPILDTAAHAARTKKSGDAWVWDRQKSLPVDISPLVAATGALWALLTQKPKETKSVWDEEDYELLVL